jgi:PncC family amidohydrolase
MGGLWLTRDELEAKAAKVGELCYENRFRLAVAESMTGGALADIICSVSGASRYFLGGIVCYMPEMKAIIGVTSETIERFGIYSKEVAAGLALGTVKRFGADVAVGITGIAEPDAENPSPGAWVAVAFRGKVETRHVVCERGTKRNDARRRVAAEALAMLLDVLIG